MYEAAMQIAALLAILTFTFGVSIAVAVWSGERG